MSVNLYVVSVGTEFISVRPCVTYDEVESIKSERSLVIKRVDFKAKMEKIKLQNPLLRTMWN
jgi:hypothetical protein